MDTLFMRVLVVEDERKIAAFIGKGLREAGYRILISLATLDADMQLLLNRLLLIFTFAIVILLMGACLIADRALRPLRNIGQAAEKIVKGSYAV